MKLADLLEEFNVVIDTAGGLNELRSLILGLAVRGKLVHQDPGDEPASELLKKIEPVREEYFVSGPHRNIPKRKKIKDEEINVKVPKGWSNTRFSSIINVINGRAYKKDELLDNGTPVLRVGNLFTSNSWYYSDLELDEHKYINKGDLIFAWSASFGPFIWDGPKVIYHYHIWKLEFYEPELISKEFLYYFLEEKTVEIKASGHGISMVHMTKGKMENLIVSLPPLNEQHRIVQRIESLFAEVDDLEEKLKRQTRLDEKLQLAVNAEVQQAPDAEASKTAWSFITSNFDTLYHTPDAIDNLKKNILNEAVRGRLVPQNPNDESASELLKKIEAEKEQLYEEGEIRKPKDLAPVKDVVIPFEIPESWEWVNFGNIIMSLRYGTSKKCDYDLGSTSVLRIPNIDNGSINIDDLKSTNLSKDEIEKLSLKVGDMLLIRSNGSENLVGRSAIVGIESEGFSYAGYLVRARLFNQYTSARYLYYNFETSFIRSSIEVPIRSTSGVKNINSTEISNLRVCLPPIEEQHRIVRRIEELFAICDRFKAQLEQRVKVNERLVKGLVSEVLEGSTNSIQEVNF